MERVAAVLVTADAGAAAPPGVDAAAFTRAVAEDTYEIVAGLDLVTPALVTTIPGMEEITWPGTAVIPIPPEEDPTPTAFAAIARALPDAEQAVLVSADAPDLPALLIGKLLRALGRATIAVCPADGGGAVAIATRLPYPDWATAGLDTPDVLRRLRAAAPRRGAVAAVPGWHRLRDPADLHRLDPGLEGWDNTRDLLSA